MSICKVLINILVIFGANTAAAFPIWGLCRVRQIQCFSDDYKKEPCDLLDNTQRVVIGSKNIMVRVYKVDRKCAWVSTAPLVLEGQHKKLTCIPEPNCRPIFGGNAK